MVRMDENAVVVELLAAVLNERIPQVSADGVDWEKVLTIARRHSVMVMVAEGLQRLPAGVRVDHTRDFVRRAMVEMARTATQEATVAKLLDVFEVRGIRALPLKGTVLKRCYPRMDMRQMADVDILVDKENIPQVKEILLEEGFYCKCEGMGNHDAFYREPYMNVEIHHQLLPERFNGDGYFDAIFDQARLKDGCHYIYEMTPEDFYLYMVAHLMKHYSGAGSGIRSIMDLWVYRHRKKDAVHWAYVDEVLSRMGMYGFSQTLVALSEVWFSGAKSSIDTQNIENYILGNGAYGSLLNMDRKNFAKAYTKEGSFGKTKRRFFLRTLFPEYDYLCQACPWFQGKRFLRPVGWVVRGVRSLTQRPKTTLARITGIRNTQEEDVETAKRLYEASGLKDFED
ncbi:MAG: nucleotidyltransferase family protein [Eubacterium sp.]